VAMLLINHYISKKSNSFKIRSLSPFTKDFQSETGEGICTFHNFINHSCNPNASFLVRNREHVLVSLRPIKEGEQVRVVFLQTDSS